MGDFQEPYGATCLGIRNTLWSGIPEIRVYLITQRTYAPIQSGPGYNPLNWPKLNAFYSDGVWSRPGSRSLMTF